MINDYKAGSARLRKLVVNIMWYMRGSVSRDEAWAMSSQERDDILHLIEERQELVKETGLPLL